MSGSNPPVDGAALRAAREACGWSQSELERRSGVGQDVISRLEAGRSLNPRIENIHKIAMALDVRIETLLSEETAKRRGYDKPGLGPTGHPNDPDVLAEIRELRDRMDALLARIADP